MVKKIDGFRAKENPLSRATELIKSLRNLTDRNETTDVKPI